MSYKKFKLTVTKFTIFSVFSVPIHAQEVYLPEVVVVGRSEGQKYYSDEANITRTETPSREIPQAIRVVPRQAIDDIGAVRLEEAYDYVSGVNRQNSFGGLWDNFSIRGFAGDPNTGANFLRNGYAGNRGYNAPRDMANVEYLEVIKGPSSALYGGSEPGGILNIGTKKPKFKPGHSAEIYSGSHDTYRTTVDSTAPITANLAYRLNMSYEKKASFRDTIDSTRYLIAPSFTWLLTPDTIVNYDFEVLRQKAPMDRGVIAINGQANSIPRDRFLGEPDDGDIAIDNKTHNLNVEHEFSNNWKAKVGLAYRTTNLEGFSSEVSPRTTGAVRWTNLGIPVIERERRYRDYASNDLSFQGEVHGKFYTGSSKHELLVGVDNYHFELDQLMKRGRSSTNYGLNIYSPVYGKTPIALNTTPTNTLENQKNTGVFLQDQISFAKNWRLLVGLRHDQFNQEIINRNNTTSITQSHNITTPRIGLTWLATPTVSAYVMGSESFRANNGTDANRQAFDPEFGKSKELGFKYEALNKQYGGTLSIFEINKRNVLTNDPINAGFLVTAGEARSKGIEFDFSGKVSNKLRILANYAYINANITKDNNPSLTGVRLINVPKYSTSVLAMYENKSIHGRYGLGAGVTYVGKRAGNSIDSFKLPSYATVRTMSYWKPTQSLRFSLDIDNLFNKNYYASSYDVYWITPGSPRTITLGMQVKF